MVSIPLKIFVSATICNASHVCDARYDQIWSAVSFVRLGRLRRGSLRINIVSTSKTDNLEIDGNSV